MYIGAEIKNEHMSEGWRRGKNETAEAQAGGRNQVTNPTSRHRRRCPRGRSVVSVVARTFGLLLLLSPYPPPPPSLPSACRSRPVRQCFWTSFLSVCIGSRRAANIERGDERKRSPGVAGWHSCDASRCVCFTRFEPLHSLSSLSRYTGERRENRARHDCKWIAVIRWLVRRFIDPSRTV